MKTVMQIIPENIQDIRKRAYRDYSLGIISRKQLNKILGSTETLKKVAEEINEIKKE